MIRVFEVPLRITVDDGNGANGHQPPTLAAVRDYLSDAAVLDVDSEEYGNPLGVSGLIVDWDELHELPARRVQDLLDG